MGMSKSKQGTMIDEGHESNSNATAERVQKSDLKAKPPERVEFKKEPRVG